MDSHATSTSIAIAMSGGKRMKKSIADRSDTISSNGGHGSTNQPPAKIESYHYRGIPIVEGKKRKQEVSANHLGSVSSTSPGIIAFNPSIFNYRASIEATKNIPNAIVNFNNNSNNKRAASSEGDSKNIPKVTVNFNNNKRAGDSLPEPATKKVKPALASAEPATKKVKPALASAPVLRKQKRRSRNGRRKRSHSIDENGAPPAIFAHKGKPTNATIASTTNEVKEATAPTRNKKRGRSDDATNEMGAPAQKKKVAQQQSTSTAVAAKVDFNQEPKNYYYCSSSSDDGWCYSSSDEGSLAGLSFSSSSEDEESSVESTSRQDWVAGMSKDHAATILQAFARGFSIRTMKPRAKPQVELTTTTTNHGQQWEMEEEGEDDVDYTATTSTEDASFFSNETTEEEANDGEVGGVEFDIVSDADTATSGGDVHEDAIELAPQGKDVEEGDEIEKEVVADNRVKPPQVEFDIASDADTATSTEGASSLSDTTVEEANDGDSSGASLDAGEVNEQFSNVLSQLVSAVKKKERKQRSYLREKARILSSLDGDYWTRPTRRRKITRV